MCIRSIQVMTLQAQLASLKAQAAQGQQGVHEDAKGYVGSAAAEQLGYGYPWCNGNGGVAAAGTVGAPAAQLAGAYGNGGHESLTALLGSSDYMQQSLYHAFEHAGADDDDGRQGNDAFEAAAESSSFGAEESGGWRSSSGYQDCEDLQSVAYAYLNHRS